MTTSSSVRRFVSWRTLFMLSFAVLIGGCASKKPPPTRADVVAQSIGEETIRSTWAEAATTGEVPDGWMKSFNDPRMEAIVIDALRNNLALRGAATRIDVAAAAAVQADALNKPVIAAGGGGGLGGVGVGLSVSWEIDVWGRLAAIQSAAEEQLAAVQNQFDFARESLAAQTAKAWYFATNTQQQLMLANETVTVHEELVRVVKLMSDAGRVTPQDLNLAQADLSAAQERARNAEGAHKEAVRSLEVLVGRYPSAELAIADEFVPVPPPVPAGVPSSVLERRLDMIAAEGEVRMAFQNVQAAKLAKLPQIGLTGSAGFASGDALNLIGDLSFFSAGANFLAPIFDAGQLEQEVVIQTANQEQALANYGQKALNAFKEVEEGLSNERLLAERETLLANAVKQNEEALRIANVRYEAGAIEVLEVLQIQSRTNLSRSALIDMRNRRLANRIDLHLALGGGFDVAFGASAPARPATRPATQPAQP